MKELLNQLAKARADVYMKVIKQVLGREPIDSDAFDFMLYKHTGGEDQREFISYKGEELGYFSPLQRINEDGSVTVGYEFTPATPKIEICAKDKAQQN